MTLVILNPRNHARASTSTKPHKLSSSATSNKYNIQEPINPALSQQIQTRQYPVTGLHVIMILYTYSPFNSQHLHKYIQHNITLLLHLPQTSNYIYMSTGTNWLNIITSHFTKINLTLHSYRNL